MVEIKSLRTGHPFVFITDRLRVIFNTKLTLCTYVLWFTTTLHL